MIGYKARFKKPYTLLAVIHVQSRTQVLRNVELAVFNGADGVFLINHGHIGVDELIEYYHAARERYPDAWIGLNMHGIPNRDAIGHIPEPDCALWTDSSGVDDMSEGVAHDFFKSSRKAGWRGMHFGGIAFKHQPPVKDLASVAKRAFPYLDVLTTSGDATGVPPSVEKIRTIRNGAGHNAVIGIASGITHRNVHEYGDANCFLVASSLLAENSFFEFDELKMLRLADAVYKMNESASKMSA